MLNKMIHQAFRSSVRKTNGVKLNLLYHFCARHFFILVLGVSVAFINGCAVAPNSVIQHPTTARAPAVTPNNPSSGAIYNNRAYRPLFEDRKARFVGDIVTINIRENTSATKAAGSSGTKDGEIETSVGSLFGTALPKATVSASGSSSYKDTAAANSSNVFSGSLTATVIEVLPNGYLLVSGEKQVSFDKGTEFVRFSGVVNPDTITIGNFVSSTTVADARVEYRTSAKIDAAEIANIASRFFFSIAGF
jgi:flagellar L-ring protein precursor FlgH